MNALFVFCILYLVFCILYAYLENIQYDISTRNHGSSQYKLATSWKYLGHYNRYV